MCRIKVCSLVLRFFGIWFVFGKTRYDEPRHNACPFMLVHNKDCEAFGLPCWGTMLSELSSIPGVLRLVM